MMFENTVEIEKALLVSLDTGEYDAEVSIAELEQLALTAGVEVAGVIEQKRPSVDKATCVGSGKLEEIKAFAEAEELDLLIFDRELSPTQIRNIEAGTGIRTVDRTMLILDIFAARARSKEGKLQVELAQLNYMLPRLTGKGIALSRQGAGIGTRGPGESKLETDRRHIHRRIDAIKEQLAEVEKHRRELHRRREKDGVQIVALVGYTNAGKSTLMNTLTGAGVLAEDMLFATLDPTARALALPDGKSVMLVDTVGFIRRLPHHLVRAFRSTLEEAAEADVVLNICDISSPESAEHLKVTNELLEKLGASGERVISVLNQCDKLEGERPLAIGASVCISAKTGQGLEDLLLKIQQTLPPSRVRLSLLIPYSSGSLTAEIRATGLVHSEVFNENGTLIDATVRIEDLHKYEMYTT
ncbi:MAG: GTPase HflX [Oscillospiraceae bacterium]|jgi:GTP-binding protein HflX|nr:GTPase HflX [Oscillospiraceae bacterium]